MFNTDYFSTTTVSNDRLEQLHDGAYTAICEIVTNILGKKNGCVLTEVAYSTGIDHYEIYFEGEFFGRYKSKKIAMAYFKDFAG